MLLSLVLFWLGRKSKSFPSLKVGGYLHIERSACIYIHTLTFIFEPLTMFNMGIHHCPLSVYLNKDSVLIFD